MNSLAAPFNFSFPKPLPVAIIWKQMLLFIYLLICASSATSAQEVVAAQPPQAKEARPGAIATGTITGNVVGEDGRPLADAIIYLSKAYSRVPGPPLTATTDSEGRFRVTNLEAGLYTVNATLAGFAPLETLTDLNDPSEVKYYKIGDNVNLTLTKGGVLTGTVRDANGDPVVAVSVRVMRLRDATGRDKRNRFSGFLPERMTDDRGIYRIYGLPPGTYVISAGGSQRFNGGVNAYEGDAQTFFPSSTRDTAAEVPVRGGEEVTGIDIRYRGEHGHTVSGTVTGFIDTGMNAGVPVLLRQPSGGGFEAASFVIAGTKPGFSFSGISDGEYEVMAQQWSRSNENSAASIPRRITVKGTDVTGIELVLSPLASISGRVTLEAAPKESCADSVSATLSETALNARRDQKTQPKEAPLSPFFSASGSIPDEKGEFVIRNLVPGSYRLTARLPSDAWYIRSIVLPKAAAPQPAAPAKAAQTKGAAPLAANTSASLLALKAGERAANVNIQIAQDAAALRGRVVTATEGAESTSLPANLKVYLVPMERERAEDVLRYSESSLGSDGSFALTNLAPGRYRLIARIVPESETPELALRPTTWDADVRAKLRSEAEAANTTIELQPCQRMGDYVLRYGAAK